MRAAFGVVRVRQFVSMKPIDAIALIIASTTAVILVLAVASPLLTGVPMSEDKARIVAGLISSFLAILSMYAGSRMKPGDGDGDGVA
jgi:hypothetical protein